MPPKVASVISWALLIMFLQTGHLTAAQGGRDGQAHNNGKAVLKVTAPPPTEPEAALLEDILEKMEAAYRSIRSCQSEFQQESETKAVQRHRESSGKIFFRKPGRMRWTYLAPDKREVYLQDNEIFIYLPGRNLVIRQTGDESFPGMAPARLFQGPDELARSFNISLGPGTALDEQTHCLRLVPKPAGGITVEEIFIWLRKDNFLPSQSESLDILGNRTKITFSDWEINVALPDELFDFEIPPDAEVMDTPF